MQQSPYRFSVDWFSKKEKTFRKLLLPYAGKSDLCFLEVGSYEGRSACWLLDNVLTHESAILHCIDPFESPSIEDAFDHNITRSRNPSAVRKHKGRAQDILPELPRASFDFIYNDGDHCAEAVEEITEKCFTTLNFDGILLFDDYLWKAHQFWVPASLKPKIAIDAFLRRRKNQLVLLHWGRTVAIRKLSQ